MIALSPLARVRNVCIELVWGMCPVQAFGTINDRPFYFRAMWSKWSFSVAATRKGDPVRVATGAQPGFHMERCYGRGHDASFMSQVQARILISTASYYYLNGGKKDADR